MIEVSPEEENFLQNFVRDFGVPAEGHTFSMATRGEVTVRTTKPTDVKIVGKVNNRRYLLADWQGVTNGQKVRFDYPADVEELMLISDAGYFAVDPVCTVTLNNRDNAAAPRSRDGEATYFDPTHLGAGQTIELIPAQDPPVANRIYGAVGSKSTTAAPCDPEIENDRFEITTGRGVESLDQYIRQFIPPTGSSEQQQKDFFTSNESAGTTSKFSAGYYAPTGVPGPGLYFSYIRKPDNKDYTIGMMIGDHANLTTSTVIYKIPIFNTEYMQEGTFNKRVPTHVDDPLFHGATVVIDFTQTTDHPYGSYTLPAATSIMGDGEFDLTCNKANNGYDAFKQQVEDMADLFAANPKILYAATDADAVAGNVAGLDALDESDQWAYYQSYCTYLHNKCEEIKNGGGENSGKIHQLKDLKAMLTYRGGNFDEYEYPEVTRDATNPNKYTVRFYCNTGSKGSDSERFQPVTNGNAARGSFFEPEGNGLVMYEGISSFTFLPESIKGNEYCLYVEYNDGTKFMTTAAPNSVRFLNDVHYDDTGLHNWWGGAIDVNGDGIYDDIIFTGANAGGYDKTGYSKYRWLLACEDLGAGGTTDIDYNDLVVALEYVSSNSSNVFSRVDISAMAAGGIYPAYLMITDNNPNLENGPQTGFVGPEIHAWLNQSDIDMYNTDGETSLTGVGGINAIHYDYDVLQHGNNYFSLSEVMGTQDFTNLGVKFWVLVDRENRIAGNEFAPAANSREIKWLDADQWSTLNSIQGIHKVNYPATNIGSDMSVPVIICVGSDWEWPQERVKISSAYPKFNNWVTNPNAFIKSESNPDPQRWYGLDKKGYLIDGVNRDQVVKRLTPNEKPQTNED